MSRLAESNPRRKPANSQHFRRCRKLTHLIPSYPDQLAASTFASKSRRTCIKYAFSSIESSASFDPVTGGRRGSRIRSVIPVSLSNSSSICGKLAQVGVANL
jgi:hypothetical protein